MNSKTYTIGLDLGDRRHHARVLNAAGEIVAEEAIVNTREVLIAFSARYPRATIVMETGTHCSANRPPRGRPLVCPPLRSGPRLRPDPLRDSAPKEMKPEPFSDPKVAEAVKAMHAALGCPAS